MVTASALLKVAPISHSCRNANRETAGHFAAGQFSSFGATAATGKTSFFEVSNLLQTDLYEGFAGIARMELDVGTTEVGLSARPAWDMDSLKRAICLAPTGTGSVRRVIETCAFKPREQAFTSLIKLCGQLRDWRKAVEVFEAMQNVRGVRPNTYTYSALIATCSTAGEWHRALEFYELMKFAARSNPECAPNKVTFSVLITACEKGGLYEKALGVYEEMSATGIPGDEVTFRAVLSACEKSRNWGRAERVLQDMHTKGLSVDSGIYSEMMLNYAQEGDWSKALDMCLTMQLAGQDPNDGVGASRMRPKKGGKKRNKGKKGVPEFDLKDLALFQLAPNVPPNKPAWDMETLKRAVCFARTGTGEVRKVIETCTFLPREQAFTAMINMCGRLRDWRKATEVFESMDCVRGVRPNTYTYSALISACSTSGEWQKALEIFQVMKISARTKPDCAPNEVTYSTVITACQRGGMVDEALELYNEMMNSGLIPDQGSFNSVLAACEKSERWDDVEKILEHMHARGLTASAPLYGDVIEYHSDRGDWRKALDVFLNMQLAGVMPDKSVVFSLMRALERGGQHQMVLELFGEMQESGIAVDAETFNCAIRALSHRESQHSLSSSPSQALSPVSSPVSPPVNMDMRIEHGHEPQRWGAIGQPVPTQSQELKLDAELASKLKSALVLEEPPPPNYERGLIGSAAYDYTDLTTGLHGLRR